MTRNIQSASRAQRCALSPVHSNGRSWTVAPQKKKTQNNYPAVSSLRNSMQQETKQHESTEVADLDKFFTASDVGSTDE
jgi:hypothetical protein